MLRRAALAGLLVLAGLAAKASARPPRIVPDTFLRGYDPVTVFFDGHPGRPGPEDHPGRFVKLTPTWPGAWRWVDDHTLLFRPATRWPPLSHFEVRVRGVRRTLSTLMAPPVSTVPQAGLADLPPVREVTLAFAQPIRPADLARMVRLRVRPLPGVGSGGTWIGPEGFTIKALPRVQGTSPARYALVLRHPIGDGHAISVRFRLTLADDPHRTFAKVSFSTRAPFRVTAAGCLAGGDPGARLVPGLLPVTLAGTVYGPDQAIRGGGDTSFVVRFSAVPVDLDLAKVKGLVRFEPSVPGLAYDVSGRLLRIRGRFDRGRRYEAIVGPAPIHDRSGRVLALKGPTTIPFFFPVRRRYLRLGAGHGIVERFGPKMIPVAGRGDTRIDLRIQKVDPLDRRFWPFPAEPVRVDEGRRPPGPGEAPPAPDTLFSDPSAALIARRIQGLGSPPISRIARLPVTRATGAATFGLDLSKDLARLSGLDAPGTYLVGVRRLDAGTDRAWVRITVTDLALTTVSRGHQLAFRVTSLSTGRPVAGATVRVQGIPAGAKRSDFVTLLDGRTDRRGLLVRDVVEPSRASLERVVVRKGRDVLVRAISDPPLTYAQGRWQGHPRGWLSALTTPIPKAAPPVPLGHLVPERPVYRPKDTVHLLGWVRARVKGRLRIPRERRYLVLVTAPDGKVTTLKAPLDDHGAIAVDYTGTDRPTGGYQAELVDRRRENVLATASFRLEAYRIPRFHVDLHGKLRVPMDGPFTMRLTAAYYAGGRVAHRPVSWRVTQFPYTWIPKGRPGYLFATDERFSRATRFAPPGAIEKHGVTGRDGGASMVVDPGLELDARPRRYVFEATVTGAGDHTVTAERTVVALPAFVLGMKVTRLVHGAKVIVPRIVAVGPGGKAIAGKRLTVRLLSRRWHAHLTETDVASGTPRYVTDVVDRKVYETHLRSGKTPVSVRLPVKAAGVYVVEVSARDRLGRDQVLSVDLYVAGPGPVPWRRPRAKVFETATDQASYAPGETAHLLVESPFQSARGLMVVEAPAGNRYVPFVVRRGKATVDLKIAARFAPRIPVHFVLERGRIPAPARREDGVDLGKPRTLAATQWVTVRPVANELKLTVDHPAEALPGHVVKMQVHLRTPAGRRVGGEVALWLVDEAVLSLGKEARLDPLPSFIRPPVSTVRIRDTRDGIFGRIPILERPGGGGENGAAAPFAHVTVRKVFKTVPFYEPRIEVGPSGDATVLVHLAGDLTVFAIRAVAVSGPGRFGVMKGSLRVRLPVIVQPALPRFVRIGDRFDAVAIARVVEGKGGAGQCEVEVHGGTAKTEGGCKVHLAPGTPARISVPVTVRPPSPAETGPGRVPKLTMKVAVRRRSDGAADAFQVGIPVLPDRRVEQRTIFERLAAGKRYALPAPKVPVRPGSVKRTVLATTRPAILRFATGVDLLLAYPNTCTEQRVSMALPAVALVSLLERFHLPYDPRLLHHTVAETMAYLSTTLGDDGLYAFWPGGTGQVGLTAYVVQFLVAAKAAGIEVPPRLLDGPLDALARALRTGDKDLVDGGAFAERAEALEALAAAGRFDVSYAGELAGFARHSDVDAGAQVLLALNDGGMGHSRLAREVASDLFYRTVFTRRHGQLAFDGLQIPRTYISPLVLYSSTAAEADMIRALWPAHAADPRLGLMLEDLLQQGTGDAWGDTHRNASVLLALGEVLEAQTGPAPSVDLGFHHDGGIETLSLGPGRPVAFAAIGGTGKATVTVPEDAPRPLAARMELAFLPKATGDSVPADSHGFVVRREVRRVEGPGAPMKRTWLDTAGRRLVFHVGDVVETHVQVVNPKRRYYVMIEVPLAAGMEPMNPALATASSLAKPSQRPTLKPAYVQFLDDSVRFYYEELPAGTFDLYYRVRASTVGDFAQPPARAQMMYRHSVRGRSNGARVVVVR